MEHLSSATIDIVNLSTDKRIAFLRRPFWIGYPLAKEILADFSELLLYPRSQRMPGRLLISPPNNGKSMILERFCKLHPPNEHEVVERNCIPVLRIQAPSKPSDNLLYTAILNAIAAPFKYSDRPEKKRQQIIDLFEHLDVRSLVIDEFHDLLKGSNGKVREILTTIKHLANDLRIPIIAAGTQEALSITELDPQMGSRLRPIRLPLWKNDATFQGLLASFERGLPLKQPSHLSHPDMAVKIYSLTDGIIGEVTTLLQTAAVEAMRDNRECITLKQLQTLRWIAPNQRRLEASKLGVL
jgi:hypothetical protein